MAEVWRLAGRTPDQKLLIGLLLLVSCLYSLLARDTYGGDFRAYYVAALASHDGLDPYVNQVNVNERYADGELLRANSRFIYPPSALFFFAPLGRLPYRMIKVAFSTGMALLMAVLLTGLSERYPGAHWIALGLFLSLPMAANIDGGQVDILILALTLSAFYARRAWIGGACLGVAISIKLFPVLVLLWLLANRRWRAAGWAFTVSGMLTVAAVKIWGVGLYREFWAHLTEHLAANPAMLTHTFKSVQVIFGRFVVIGASTYSLHYFYGTRQNPLYHLGAVGTAIGLALVLGYVAWVIWNKHGKALPQDASFSHSW